MNLKRIIAATLLSAGSLGLLAGCSNHSENAEGYTCHQGADSPGAAVAQFVEGLRSGGEPACSVVLKKDGWDLNDPTVKAIVERMTALGEPPHEDAAIMLNPVKPIEEAFVFTVDTGRPLLLIQPVYDDHTGKYFVKWSQNSLASEANTPEYMKPVLAKLAQK
ncbi:hypothetical protein ACUH88_02070 [Dermabacteraceae bacterium P13095]